MQAASRRHVIHCLLMLPLAVSLLGARQAQLVDPDPIDVPPGMSIALVSRLIQTAIVKRRWWVEENEDGRMVAVLKIRGHTAKVAISYDEKSVRIQYLSSEKLDYEIKDDGLPYIHPNYLNWVKNMKADIFRGLNFPIVE